MDIPHCRWKHGIVPHVRVIQVLDEVTTEHPVGLSVCLHEAEVLPQQGKGEVANGHYLPHPLSQLPVLPV